MNFKEITVTLPQPSLDLACNKALDEAKLENVYEVELTLKDLVMRFKDRYDGDLEAHYTFTTNIEESECDCDHNDYSYDGNDDNKSDDDDFVEEKVLTEKEKDLEIHGFHIRKKNGLRIS